MNMAEESELRHNGKSDVANGDSTRVSSLAPARGNRL